MGKIGRNSPCPCGSGKKYKKCCLGKTQRQHTVMVGSPVPLKGFHYDRETMTLEGIAHDSQLVKPAVTFSQTHYLGKSGKEKVLTRVQDKVIPTEADLMKHLSSFDAIIAIDTNTMQIGGEAVSASRIVQCRIRAAENPDAYSVEFQSLESFRLPNCRDEGLSPEKQGWVTILKKICRDPGNAKRSFCLVSDHDLDNHGMYNCGKLPIFRDIYLPSNFTITYGKGDSSKESILNSLIGICDKQATKALKEIEEGSPI